MHRSERLLQLLHAVDAAGGNLQPHVLCGAELVARFFKAAAEGAPKADALRRAKAGPAPDLSGGIRYLKLERMAYYVNKDVYRAAVRKAAAALA